MFAAKAMAEAVQQQCVGDEDAIRMDFFAKVLPVIKGEAESPPGFVFLQGDPVYVLVADWLEYRGLIFTRSVLRSETTPPADSGAVEVLMHQNTSSMVDLHESMLTSIEAMLERSGVIQNFRARLLVNRYSQFLRVYGPRNGKVIARSAPFDTICSLVHGWLDNIGLIQARDMLRCEVKHEYDLDMEVSDVDLEVVLQRFIDRTGKRPEYLEEIV